MPLGRVFLGIYRHVHRFPDAVLLTGYFFFYVQYRLAKVVLSLHRLLVLF